MVRETGNKTNVLFIGPIIFIIITVLQVILFQIEI